MTIQWRDEMSIDQGVIDHDHQTLIAIINEFCEAKVGKGELPRLERIVAKLEHYAEVHFGREEALQRAAQYAYHDAHHHEHEDIIKQLATIRRDLVALPPNATPVVKVDDEQPAQSPAAEPSSDEIVRVHAEVAEFLHHWLVGHIIKSDLRMKPYAAKMASHARALSPLATAVTWV